MATRNNYLQGTATRGSYSPAVYTPIAYNAIGMDAPIQEDFNTLANSLKQLEDRKEKTEALTSTISSELGKLNLNPSEDAWKFNYINDIKNQINEAIQFGDYSRALTKARDLASEAFNNPALQGRVKASRDYETSKQEVMNRNDIDQITKDRWLAENKYHYEDKKDEAGNIVGGSTWTPQWNPVKRLDRKDFYSTLKDLVAPEVGTNVDVVYMNENGEYTKDYKKGTMGLAIKTSTGYSRITPEKYRRAFDELWKQYPDAVKALEQEFKDNKFAVSRYDKEILNNIEKLNTLDPNSQEYKDTEQAIKEASESRDIINNSITDREGNYLKQEDYLKSTVYPMLGEMSRNDITHKDITVGDAATNLYKYRQSQQAAANALKTMYNDDYGVGPTVEEETMDNYTLASTSVESAYDKLVKEFPQFGQTNSLVYKYIKQGKVNDAIKLAKKYLQNNTFKDIDSGKKNRMMDLLNIMEDSQATLNALNSKIYDDNDKQAISFTSMFDGNGILPNKQNNRFTDEFNKAKNGIFGDSETIAIQLQTDNEDNQYRYTKALNAVGLTKEAIEGTGAEIKPYNGKVYLFLPKNSKYTNKILYGFSVTKDDFWHKLGNVSRVHKVDKDGNIGKPLATNKRLGDLANVMSESVEDVFKPLNRVIDNASARSKSAIKQAGKMTTYTPITLYGTYGARDEDLLNYRVNGLLDESTYKNLNERNIAIKNKLVTTTDLANHKVFYDANNENGVLKPAGNEEKNQIAEWFAQARDNKRAFDWQYASKDGEYGVYVNFGSKLDKNGNPIETNTVYGGLKVWIPGLFADEAEQAVTRNTKTRTIKKLSDLQHYNTQYTTVFGNTISNVYNDGNNAAAKINGQNVYYEQAQQEILKDLDFRNLEQIFNSTNFNNPSEVNKFKQWFRNVMTELYPGLNPDDTDYAIEANNIMKLLVQRNSKQ